MLKAQIFRQDVTWSENKPRTSSTGVLIVPALQVEAKFGKKKRRNHPAAATAQSTRRLTAVRQRSASGGANDRCAASVMWRMELNLEP